MNVNDLKNKILTRKKEQSANNQIITQPPDVVIAKITPIQEHVMLRIIKEKKVSYFHFAVNFEGLLDEKNLFTALNKVIEKHQALRVSFFEDETGWKQKINPFIEKAFMVTDLSSLPYKEAKLQSDVLLHQLAETPIKFLEGELFRLHLVRVSETFNRLIVVIAHICCDFSSLAILTGDFIANYEELTNQINSSGKSNSVGYLDYAKWLETKLDTENISQKEAFWKNYLKDATPLCLSENFKTEEHYSTEEIAEHEFFELQKATKDKIDDLMLQQPYTLFMICLAVFALLIFSKTKKNSFVIGIPTGGRDRPELETIIGGFTSLLGIYIEINSEQTFTEFLEYIRKNTQTCLSHQDTPPKLLEDAAPEIYKKENKPLIELIFAQNAVQQNDQNITGLKIMMEMQETHYAPMDFSFIVYSKNNILFSLEYKKSAFSTNTIKDLYKNYNQILSNCLSHPNQTVAQLLI
jgi:Condensation domain